MLMNHLNMKYFWNRLHLYFSGREPELEELSKIMNRCIKLYDCVNDLMKIFKFIEKFENIQSNLEGHRRLNLIQIEQGESLK